MDFIGEPYLVGWSDGTLRLYRKSAGVFVQLDSKAVIAQAVNGHYPRPFFSPAGQLFFSNPAAGSNTAWLSRVDYLTNSITSHASLFNMGTGSNAARRFDVLLTGSKFVIPNGWSSDLSNIFLGWSRQANVGSGNTATNGLVSAAWRPSSNSIVGSKQTAGLGVANETTDNRMLEISPDDTVLAYQNQNGLYWLEYDPSRLPTNDPWTTSRNDMTYGSIRAFAWGADSQSLVAIADDQKKLVLYMRDGVNLTSEAVVDIPETPMSVAYFGPFVAVGGTYEDGTTKYRTRIYKKSGVHLIPHMVIEDMGYDLLFTNDGLTLIDCFTKKAYTREGTVFTDASSMMVNIATNTTTAALSQHTSAGVTAMTAFYPGAAADFAADEIDMGTLAFLLLDNTATFNTEHTTVDAVTDTGAMEVSGNNWPAGGLLLENVIRQKTMIGVDVIADDIDQSIFGGDIVARYGLIYSGTRPLIFVDFGTDRTIHANESLAFDLSDGIVSIGV